MASAPGRKDEQVQEIKLSDELVREVHHGVHTTLAGMFGIRPVAEQHFIEEECAANGDVSGIVGLVQERIEGVLIVSFPRDTIFAILGMIYGRKFSEIDNSIKAGVGELTNIIFGVVKSNLNRNGFTFKMALPNVIIGAQHVITNPGTTLVIPFRTEAGTFKVQITLYPVDNRE